MLAESALHFGVVDEVSQRACSATSRTYCCALRLSVSIACFLLPQVAERLNLKLSASEVEQAKTDAYIVERLIAALAVLKRCSTLNSRIDLHVILAAVAP
eukprot:7171080-Prymnesium_polylepis.1